MNLLWRGPDMSMKKCHLNCWVQNCKAKLEHCKPEVDFPTGSGYSSDGINDYIQAWNSGRLHRPVLSWPDSDCHQSWNYGQYLRRQFLKSVADPGERRGCQPYQSAYFHFHGVSAKILSYWKSWIHHWKYLINLS